MSKLVKWQQLTAVIDQMVVGATNTNRVIPTLTWEGQNRANLLHSA